MTGNDVVRFLLRTPLHIFLGNTILLTVTGRKTGKKYSTPVGYYPDGDTLWVLTNRDRTWWRNVKNGAGVSLLRRGKTIEAFAVAELEEKAVEAHLVEYLRRIPMAAKSLGVRMEYNTPNSEDVKRVAKNRLFVRIQPDR